MRFFKRHECPVQELPVVEISYEKKMTDSEVEFVTTVRYAGMCHGFIEGQEYWSLDGAFVLTQKANLVDDAGFEQDGTAVDF